VKTLYIIFLIPNFPKLSKEDDCVALVTRALTQGMMGDNASGNAFNLVTITKEGTRFKGPIVPDFCQRPRPIELDYLPKLVCTFFVDSQLP
jgi:hypothetical protein